MRRRCRASEDEIEEIELNNDSGNRQDFLVDPEEVYKHSFYVNIDQKLVHKSNAVNSILNKATRTKSSKDRLLRVQGVREIELSNQANLASQDSDDFVRITDLAIGNKILNIWNDF